MTVDSGGFDASSQQLLYALEDESHCNTKRKSLAAAGRRAGKNFVASFFIGSVISAFLRQHARRGDRSRLWRFNELRRCAPCRVALRRCTILLAPTGVGVV